MKLELELNEIGCGRVILDGKDISNDVCGVTLRARVGQLTRLRIDYAKTAVRAALPIAMVEP
jgi:hypothetical protein